LKDRQARSASSNEPYPFPYAAGELDFRPLLHAVARDRVGGRDLPEIARSFQGGIAVGVAAAAKALTDREKLDTVVLSGGVFQNEMLLEDLKTLLGKSSLHIWTNHSVPANDGGISLGQAALAAVAASTL
jgi:hydrogenase maturation protein HypF